MASRGMQATRTMSKDTKSTISPSFFFFFFFPFLGNGRPSNHTSLDQREMQGRHKRLLIPSSITTSIQALHYPPS